MPAKVRLKRFDPRRVNALYRRIGREAIFGRSISIGASRRKCKVCLVGAMLVDAGVTGRSLSAMSVDNLYSRAQRIFGFTYKYVLGLVHGWDRSYGQYSEDDYLSGYKDGGAARMAYREKHPEVNA